jgi:hypothetical protein
VSLGLYCRHQRRQSRDIVSTVPSTDETAFYITLPEGWSVVDFRSLLDGFILDTVKLALGDTLTTVDARRMELALSSLREELDAENMILMALRSRGESGALHVLTVACPSPEFARETQSSKDPESQSKSSESPGEVIELSSGSDAMIHRAATNETPDRVARWASVQLVMRIPEAETAVILTLLSSDDRDLDALTTEASALAQSISTSTVERTVTEIALS